MHGKPASARIARASRRAVVLSCVLALAITAAATAATLQWSATDEVALPVGANATGPDAALSFLACPTAGACIGAGSYLDVDGHGRALVAAQSGARWGAAQALALPAGAASDPQAVPTALDCASAGDCAVTGTYVDATDGAQAMVAGRAAGAWSAAQRVDLPGDADAVAEPVLSAVTCPAAGACSAVGSYFTGAGTFRAMVATRSAGTWSAATALDLPADADTANPQAALYAVACASAGSCTAAGSYLDEDGAYQAMLATQSGGTWSAAAKVAAPAGARTEPSAYLNAIACPAAGACTALGAYLDASGAGRVMTATTSGPATALSLPADANAIDPAAAVSGLDCASATACAAVGSYRDGTGVYRPFVASRTSGWAPAVGLALPADADPTIESSLDAVACPAAGACVAGGSYANASSQLRPMIATEAGAATRVALPANAGDLPDAHVRAVACDSEQACDLAGDYTTASDGRHPLVIAGRPAPPPPVSQPSTPEPIAPPAPTPTPTPTRTVVTSARPALKLQTTKLTVRKGAVKVKLACASARCSGTIRITRGRTVLASASYAVARGATRTITVRLTKAGKRALRHAKRHPVRVKVAIAVRGAAPTTKSLLVR